MLEIILIIMTDAMLLSVYCQFFMIIYLFLKEGLRFILVQEYAVYYMYFVPYVPVNKCECLLSKNFQLIFWVSCGKFCSYYY